MILATCRATIGEVGNEQHGLVNIGKAGRTRWLGKKTYCTWICNEPERSPTRWW